MFVIVGCSETTGEGPGGRVGLVGPFQVLDTEDGIVESCDLATLHRLKEQNFVLDGVQEITPIAAVVAGNAHKSFISKAGKGGVLPYGFKFAHNKDKTAVKITVKNTDTAIRVLNKASKSGEDASLSVLFDKTPAFRFDYAADIQLMEDVPLYEIPPRIYVANVYVLRDQMRVALGFELLDTETGDHIGNLMHIEVAFSLADGSVKGAMLGMTYPYVPNQCVQDFLLNGDHVGNLKTLIPTL